MKARLLTMLLCGALVQCGATTCKAQQVMVDSASRVAPIAAPAAPTVPAPRVPSPRIDWGQILQGGRQPRVDPSPRISDWRRPRGVSPGWPGARPSGFPARVVGPRPSQPVWTPPYGGSSPGYYPSPAPVAQMPERNEIPAATPPRNELPSLNFSGDYPDAFGTADDLADQPGWDEAEEGTSVDDAALYADAAAAAEAEKERLAYEARQAEAAAERERLEQQAALEELGASGSAGGPSPLETKPPSKAPGTLASDAKPGDKSTPQAGEWPDGKPLGQEAADTLSDTVVTPPAGGTTDTAPVAPPHTPLIPGMANAPPALPGGGKTTFERLKERYERQQKERGVVDRISDSVADYFKESQRQEEYKREILRKAAYDELSDEERMKHARLLDGIEDDYTLEAIGANFIPLPLGNLGRAATIEAREAGIAAKTAATDLLEQAGRGGGTAAKEALEAGAARARKQAAEAAAKKREDMLKPLADRKPVDNVGVQNAEIDRIHKEFIETGYWPKDKTLGGSYAAPMPDEILMKARQEFLKANPSKSGQ